MLIYRILNNLNHNLNLRLLSTNRNRCNSCEYSKIYVCDTCNLPIINFTSISPFNLFKLPLQYVIDKSVLKTSYLQYQNVLHPDKHSGLTKSDMNLITDSSSYVNEAYKLLLDDRRRGIELLSQLGQETKLEECNVSDIFEIHESIDSLESDSDAKILKNKIENRIDDIINEIDKHFIEKNYDKVRSGLSMLGYFNTIFTRLEEYD